MYDIKQDFPDKAKKRLRTLGQRYIEDVNATEKQIDEEMGKISFTKDMLEAVMDADLTIEAIPKISRLKRSSI